MVVTGGGPPRMASAGGHLPLALAVSSVRYPIPERIFDYVCTVRSATAGTCHFRTPLNLRALSIHQARSVDAKDRAVHADDDDLQHDLRRSRPPGGPGLHLNHLSHFRGPAQPARHDIGLQPNLARNHRENELKAENPSRSE